MNWLDSAILGIVGLSTIIGIYRGLTREVLSLASWAIAILFALKFCTQLAPHFEKYVAIPELRLALAFLAIFLVLIIIGAGVNFLISSMVRKTVLSGTDRLLGLFFGASRGVFVAVLLLLIGSVTPLQHKTVWKESQLLPKLDPLGLWVLSFVPDTMLKNASDPAES